MQIWTESLLDMWTQRKDKDKPSGARLDFGRASESEVQRWEWEEHLTGVKASRCSGNIKSFLDS